MKNEANYIYIYILINICVIDAPSVRLDIDEYFDAHVITGLFKKYLRELPEPLLTNTYYSFFIDNTSKSIGLFQKKIVPPPLVEDIDFFEVDPLEFSIFLH